MPQYEIAHIRERGVDLIIAPVQHWFGSKTEQEKQQLTSELQARANSANLRGTVVPVWDDGNGRMGFFAPRSFHPFFASINLQWVAANINRKLYW